MISGVESVEVVLANNDRVTLRVGDTFLKIDSDQSRIDVEVEAMALAPVPTPEVLWRQPPVLALRALRGAQLSQAKASPAAWTAIGQVLRALHDAPLPPWAGHSMDDRAQRLETECVWLRDHDVLPADVITRNRRIAEAVLRPWTPAFIHGDLHHEHVFIDGDRVTGIIDWSEAQQGDPLFDIASLTLAHPNRLDDLLTGYGADVDRDLIRAWWSYRCLIVIPFLMQNGYGDPEGYPEVALLRSAANCINGTGSGKPRSSTFPKSVTASWSTTAVVTRSRGATIEPGDATPTMRAARFTTGPK